jgi:hypothetical protein
MVSRLHNRLSRIESQKPTSMTADAQKLLVSLLGRRDALFYPWRCIGSHRGSIARMTREYFAGKLGMTARSQGESNWKTGHHNRNELVAAGQCTATVSGGQVTGLLLTPKGESDARALVGDRLSNGEFNAVLVALMLERSDRDYGDRKWCSEYALFELPNHGAGDPASWQHLTEWVLPLLVAGAVVANCDAWGRVYYSVCDNAEIPAPLTSELAATDEFDSVYVKSFNSERVELGKLDDADGEILIPIPCTR